MYKIINTIFLNHKFMLKMMLKINSPSKWCSKLVRELRSLELYRWIWLPVELIIEGGLHCCNVGGGIAPVRCSFPHTWTINHLCTSILFEAWIIYFYCVLPLCPVLITPRIIFVYWMNSSYYVETLSQKLSSTSEVFNLFLVSAISCGTRMG